MRHRRGAGHEEKTDPGHDPAAEVTARFARGTVPGMDRIIDSLEEGVVIAQAVQQSIGAAIFELRAALERAEGLAPSMVHRIDRAMASLLPAQRLVGEMIDLASLDAHRLVLRREPAVMAELVPEALDRYLAPAQRRTVKVEARQDMRCRLDRDRIQRVIGSFLQVAVSCGYPGAPIAIRVEQHDHRARVSMTDTGPGLTASQAHAIFEKRHPTIARSTSIGLYVSRKIVEAHGGTVGVDTIPSVGATFSFELPVMA